MIPEPPPPATGSARQLVRDSVASVRDGVRRALGLGPIDWELTIEGATPDQALAWVEAALTRPWLVAGAADSVSYSPGSRRLWLNTRDSSGKEFADFTAVALPGGAAALTVRQQTKESLAATFLWPVVGVSVLLGLFTVGGAFPWWTPFASALIQLGWIRLGVTRGTGVFQHTLRRALDRRGGGVV